MRKIRGFELTAPTGEAAKTAQISFDKTYGKPYGMALTTPFADSVAAAIAVTVNQGDYKPVEDVPALSMKPDGNREFIPISPFTHGANINVRLDSASGTPAGESCFLILFFDTEGEG